VREQDSPLPIRPLLLREHVGREDSGCIGCDADAAPTIGILGRLAVGITPILGPLLAPSRQRTDVKPRTGSPFTLYGR
jgi:hypothetical protein